MTGIRRILIIFLHAIAGWALCGAVMGAGPLFMSMQNTLIVHAVAAPVFFAALSILYFCKFNFTAPLLTAIVFVSFVMLVDFFIVALLILGTLEMFTSPIGTWIPFVLIFLATFITGKVCRRYCARGGGART